MGEPNDHELLAQYACSESEAAFASLAGRYVNLVYSSALRFTRDPHHAEEITQAVFIILARKAKGLRRGTVLSGWLYQTARLTAANFVRGEMRRRRREQEAYMQTSLQPSAVEAVPAAWEEIGPLLDGAMGQLVEADRNAIVLRFFENKSAREVAAVLKLSESAASKRVSRALEKLRGFLAKRGVMLPGTLIAGAIAACSVQAAPAGLASAAIAAAVKGTAAGGSTTALVKGTSMTMAWMKAKAIAAVAIVVLAVAMVVLLLVHKAAVRAPWKFTPQSQPPEPERAELAPPAAAPQVASAVGNYALQVIATIPGLTSSQALGVNNQGQVVGMIEGSNGLVHAFVWEQGRTTDLGTFGGSKAIATSINSLGEIVGVVSTNGQRRVYLLSRTNVTDLGMIDEFGKLGTEGNITYIPGGITINDQSRVSGRLMLKDGNQRSFLSSGGQTSYFGLRGDGSLCYAEAMNNRGQIAGMTILRGDSPWGIFLWQDGEMTDLKTLGGRRAHVCAMNDHGTVVGWANPTNAVRNESHAIIWDKGQMLDLTAAGWKTSSALGINNAGEVVGFATTSEDRSFAFLKHGNDILDLNDLVATNSGWRLVSAQSINERGQILARGVKGGQWRDLILSPTNLPVFVTAEAGIASTSTPSPSAAPTPFNLTTFERLTSGGFRLAFAGMPGGQYFVEASTNLTSWTLLGPALNDKGNVEFTDPDAGRFTLRFYRAVQAPAPER
jgi:RNA polymerase sigma factor (sigma-70 family)